MTKAESAALVRILSPVPHPIIVELGAYHGEDFESLLGRDLFHLMVEPDPLNVDRIPRGTNRTVISGAIANKNESRPFYRSSGDHGSGSILEPTGHLTHFPYIDFEKPFPVQCYTLDYLYNLYHLNHIDLLYVDVQGAESEMIEGGTVALAHTRYLFMEAEEVEFYRGQKVRPLLLAMLPNWKLLETFDYNVLLENTSVQSA